MKSNHSTELIKREYEPQQNNVHLIYLPNGLVHMGVKLQGHFHQRPHIAALRVRDARHVQSIVVVQKEKKEIQ